MNKYKITMESGQIIEYVGENYNRYICSNYPDGWLCIDLPDGGVIHININLIETIEEVPIVPPKKPWDDVSIDALDLSVRSYNCLARKGINTVQGILDYAHAHGGLKGIRNLGAHSQCEIYKAVKEKYGLDLAKGDAADDANA